MEEHKPVLVKQEHKPLTKQVAIAFNIVNGGAQAVGGNDKITVQPLGFSARYVVVRTFSYEDAETKLVDIGPYYITCAQFGGQPLGTFLGGEHQKTLYNPQSEIYIDTDGFGKNAFTLQLTVEGFGIVENQANPPDGSCIIILEFRSEL